MNDFSERPPFFIFEMANNHQGDLGHGLRIIEAMGEISRKFGIRAGVKFQYRDLDSFIHPSAATGEQKHVVRFRETRMAKDGYKAMVEAVRAEGMTVVCTPFDEQSVADLVSHGVEIIKVASCSANDWPLLSAIVAAKKPVILSTGGLSLDEIDQVVTFLEHRNVVSLSILHCVGVYPTPPELINLNVMKRLQQRFRRYEVGYSGHEAPDDTSVVMCAIAKGARILERHVGLPTDKVSLNAYSMSPQQVERWVEAALAALRIGGREGGEKDISSSEAESLRSLRRGAFVRSSVKKGDALTSSEVYFAFPCAVGQTSASEYQDGILATRAYAVDEPLMERRGPSSVSEVRGIIREAKSMLREARIEVGNRFLVEMSHHFGVENFRKVGCVLVNVVNREYCKKLLVMIPGQRHPNHRHLIKEETFQLLSGDIEITVDGNEVRRLTPGETFLIERGQWHAFSTESGCIVEEISTTHVVGDSEYQDPLISRLDPMQRKTILEAW
ncbi:N-acetylneuraminate synthase family protein [Rhodocyclus tenuis]|uniref:N-acetylneuraminate synthase n=1 Tax=Rhodocyclus tenuis TaxID=1066 RepID=A0A840G1K1_RHOTE|nr:N-acetylneuraminate synthase family protein [Rhodocyclus tenuis]MBB4246313.1 N-acetylneuraminate synthase [Rhodocyclus tenuis]